MDRNKPVFAICHAAQLLITDAVNAGAEHIDAEVAEDGNLISSRQPSDLPAFIQAALKKLKPAAVQAH